MDNIKGSLKFFRNTKSKLILLSFMYIIIGIISFITPILTANLLAGLIYVDFYIVFWYAIYVCFAFSHTTLHKDTSSIRICKQNQTEKHF
jgi:uncharacterized membrane protein